METVSTRVAVDGTVIIVVTSLLLIGAEIELGAEEIRLADTVDVPRKLGEEFEVLEMVEIPDDLECVVEVKVIYRVEVSTSVDSYGSSEVNEMEPTGLRAFELLGLLYGGIVQAELTEGDGVTVPGGTGVNVADETDKLSAPLPDVPVFEGPRDEVR